MFRVVCIFFRRGSVYSKCEIGSKSVCRGYDIVILHPHSSRCSVEIAPELIPLYLVPPNYLLGAGNPSLNSYLFQNNKYLLCTLYDIPWEDQKSLYELQYLLSIFQHHNQVHAHARVSLAGALDHPDAPEPNASPSPRLRCSGGGRAVVRQALHAVGCRYVHLEADSVSD